MKSGKFKKLFKTNGSETTEIDFYEAIKDIKADKNEKPIQPDEYYYEFLHKNLQSFEDLLNGDEKGKLNRYESKILTNIRFCLKFKSQLSSFDRNFLYKVRELVEEGSLSKSTSKKIYKQLESLKPEEKSNPLIIRGVLRDNISKELLNTESVQDNSQNDDFKEIILSEYFIK